MQCLLQRIISALFVLIIAVGGALAQEMVLFVGAESTGNRVVVNKGMQVKIVLPGNASTGHRWEIIADGSPTLVPDGTISYLPEGATITAGGRFTAVFKAVQGGETRIRLAYRGPSDPVGSPERTYELPVSVAAYFSIEAVFRTLDSDGDGRISRAEFMSARAVPGLVNPKGNIVLPVGTMERNEKGEIDRDVLRNSFFADMDRNRDGYIDRTELQHTVGQGFIMLVW